MPDIKTLRKPEIYLVGNMLLENSDTVGYSEGIYDHSVDYDFATTTNIIRTNTVLDRDLDIPLFMESVRVIITPVQTPKETYPYQSLSLGSTEFQGDKKYSGTATNKFNRAVVYYTLNGADPRKNPLHLYTYLDMNDRIVTYDNPSEGGPLGGTGGGVLSDNINTLGFVIGAGPTGNDNITIKARTFFRGQVSSIAIAKIRIARPGSKQRIGRIEDSIRA